MKTVQQIMQETGAEANIRNFRYMQENYTYKQKIRHAENVARSYQDKCSEMGLNCHISVGGLDSITLHYFLEACGVHVPCFSLTLCPLIRKFFCTKSQKLHTSLQKDVPSPSVSS